MEMVFKGTLVSESLVGLQHLQAKVSFFLIYFAPSERHLIGHRLKVPLSSRDWRSDF